MKRLLPDWIVRNIWPDTPPTKRFISADPFLEDELPKELNVLAEIAQDPIHAIQILLRVGEPHIYVTYDHQPGVEFLVLALSESRHTRVMPECRPGEPRQGRRVSWYDLPKILLRGESGISDSVTMFEGEHVNLQLTPETKIRLDRVTSKEPSAETTEYLAALRKKADAVEEVLRLITDVSSAHIPVNLTTHTNRTGHLYHHESNPHLNTTVLTRTGEFNAWPVAIYGGYMLPVYGVEYEFASDIATIRNDLVKVKDARNLTDAHLLEVQGQASVVMNNLRRIERGDVVRRKPKGDFRPADAIVIQGAASQYEKILVVEGRVGNSWTLHEDFNFNFDFVMTAEQAHEVTKAGRKMLDGLSPKEFIDLHYPEPEFTI